MLWIKAEYDVEPEFKFHGFVGSLGVQTKVWKGDGCPVEAFKEMKRDLIRDGIHTGGEREHLYVGWSSSMNDIVFDSPYGYIENGELEVDGKVYIIKEMLVHWDEEKGGPLEVDTKVGEEASEEDDPP